MTFKVKSEFVYLEATGTFWDYIMCGLLSCHDWQYWRMSESFEKAFPYDRSIERTCIKCGMMETAQESRRDGMPQVWTGRI